MAGLLGSANVMIPACRDDGTQLVALRDTQSESASLAMVGDDDGQTVEVLCNIFASRRVDAHQTVGQLNGRETGNQQMADANRAAKMSFLSKWFIVEGNNSLYLMQSYKIIMN